MKALGAFEALVMIVFYGAVLVFLTWALCLRLGLLPFVFYWPSPRGAAASFAGLETQSLRFFAPGFKQVYAGGGIRHFRHKKRRDGNGIAYEAMMYGELVGEHHRRMAWAKGYGADVMMLNRPAFLSYATYDHARGGSLIVIRLDGPVSFREMPLLILSSVWTAWRGAYARSGARSKGCDLPEQSVASTQYSTR